MNIDKFKKVLDEVFAEIAGPEGKGFQRHGTGTPLENQPWVKITENVGDGFLLGQALKKIFELQGKDPEKMPDVYPSAVYAAWRKEILGAISYLVFAVLWKDKQLYPATLPVEENFPFMEFQPKNRTQNTASCSEVNDDDTDGS